VGFANGTSQPDPYDFGTLGLHEERSVTFRFPNVGGDTLEIIQGLTADGDFRTHATPSGSPPNLVLETVIASARSGDEIEVKATFTAVAAGPHAGTLTIPTNAHEPAGGAIRIPISAQVAALDVVLVQPAPGSVLDLGSIDVGDTRVSSITVRNAGTMNATLVSSTISSPGVPQIEVGTGPIAKGQTQAYNVACSPSETGPLTADVTLHFTDGSGPSRYSQDVVLKVTAIGVGARAELTPALVEFGTLAVGAESAPRTVLVRNVGQKVLTISNWPQLAAFRFIGTPPASVAPGQTEQLSIAFRPGHDGDGSGELSLLASNSTPPPPPVSMHGVGVVQSLLGAEPDALSFGEVPVGSRSEAQVVVVRNRGATVVRLGTAGIVGAGSSDFRVLSTTAGTVLQREGTLEVRIVFAPSSAGGNEATLEVAYEGPDSPLRISLVGRGSAARGLVPDAIDLDFGGVAVGDSTEHRLVLTNAERTAANIKNVVIDGAAAADFKIVRDECSRSVLEPGDQCVLVVSARPSSAGRRAASLEVNADVPAGAVSLHVDGVASAVTWSAALVDFGDMIVGVQAPRQEAYIHNAGNAPITVSLIELDGDFTFKDLSPTVMTIAQNQEKSFWLWFKPTAVGRRQSFLRVHSDAPGSPHTLELTGLAFAAPTPPPRPSSPRRPR
jgi:hypothetical protein